MNDMVKTGVFAGAAFLVSVVAWVAQPRQEAIVVDKQIGEPLFPKFASPSDASRLEIVQYDDELGELHAFEVARDRKTGAWSIPSHGNYPADAEDQMRDSTTGLIDLRPLAVASELASDHKTFGVVEPDKEKLAVGDEGVGLLVRVSDKSGDTLASLVVGAKVKGEDEQRFVRIPGQDAVYVVKIDPEKFSTKFEDWIEKDLMQLNALDVERVKISDYGVVNKVVGNTLRPTLFRKSDVSVEYDSADAKWNLLEMVSYDAETQEPRPVDLSDVEELDSTALNNLKSAADDLKIVDVRRKPAGLGANLEAGDDFLNDPDAIDSLESRGFLRGPTPDGKTVLYAANGEVAIGLKDGVEYILRFGDSAGKADGDTEGGDNRYLFVMARVDESKFPEPELMPLPALPGEPAPAAGPPTPGEGQPSEERGESGGDGELQSDVAADSDDASNDAADEVASGDEGDDAKGKQDAAAAPPQENDDDASSPPADRTAIEAERERIKKENQRKIDERNDKIKGAQERVRELNARFADWYYVISDETYKKIHLDTLQIVTESADAKEKGYNLDAFRDLQESGIEDKSSAPAGGQPPGSFGGGQFPPPGRIP